MLELITEKQVSFPKGFLWGAGTAGHQIEGGNDHAQRWEMEQKDRRTYPEVSGQACDSWNRMDRDAGMAAQLELGIYRFSIEWSRIEPEEGCHDEAALSRYLHLMERLHQHHIRCMVTLHHFTHPAWFERKGGFSKRENIGDFLRHIRYLVPRIAPLVDSFVVFNEVNGDNVPAINKVVYLLAHGEAASVIRQYSSAPIGIAHAYTPFFPEEPEDEFDRMECDRRNWMANKYFFHAVRTGEILVPGQPGIQTDTLKNSCDYWGINYYTRHYVSARHPGVFRPRPSCDRVKMLASDFYLEEIYPEGLLNCLLPLRDKPVYITENGCACEDDQLRILYMARHFSAMAEAARRGVDLKGYLAWSLMDNYEWGSYEPRFGLYSIDRKTFEATAKPSADFFREVIRRNGFDADLLRRFVPSLNNFQVF